MWATVYSVPLESHTTAVSLESVSKLDAATDPILQWGCWGVGRWVTGLRAQSPKPSLPVISWHGLLEHSPCFSHMCLCWHHFLCKTEAASAHCLCLVMSSSFFPASTTFLCLFLGSSDFLSCIGGGRVHLPRWPLPQATSVWLREIPIWSPPSLHTATKW